MNKLCKLLIILLLSLLCLTTLQKQSHSANWLYIVTNNNIKYYVEVDSITVNYKAHTIKFWDKHVYPSGSRLALNLCDYNEKSYTMLFMTEYDSNGKTIFNGSLPTQKNYVIQGSVFEMVLSEVLILKGIK